MYFFHKTLLVNNIQALVRLINHNTFTPSFCFYGDRIAINHQVIVNKERVNSIRIWKTKSLLDYWYDDFSNTRSFLAALDYTLQDDYVKIEYVNINDIECPVPYDIKLTDEEADKIMNSLIQFMKIVARTEEKPKIILDVHHNLHKYNQYFKNRGFLATETKSLDNPFWIETEFILPPS